MALVFEENKIVINLSNTESISSSIFNYSDLQKTKPSSFSSTSSYFLSTNLELSKRALEYLNCDNSMFVVDVVKTRKYINDIDKLLGNYDKHEFHGELKDYYNYKNYYFANDCNFTIGFAKMSIEEGMTGRSYLRFNNDDEHVKIFRGIIIAIFTSLIIEKNNGKNYIYPIVKKEIRNMSNEKVKNDFRSYMLYVKKLNESSVNQYIDVIDYTSKDAISDGILDKSIYEYANAGEVREILETLKQNDHFNTITFKRNNINTAAVGNYIQYLDYKNENSENITNDEEMSKNKEVIFFEKNVETLIDKLKKSSNNEEKTKITKEIIRNCYELLNYYK